MIPEINIISIELEGSTGVIEFTLQGQKHIVAFDKLKLMQHLFMAEYAQYRITPFDGDNEYDQAYISGLKINLSDLSEMCSEKLDIK